MLSHASQEQLDHGSEPKRDLPCYSCDEARPNKNHGSNGFGIVLVHCGHCQLIRLGDKC